MKYSEPLNSAQFPDRTGQYVDAIPVQGVIGSTVPASAIEHTQREIVNAIQGAGLDPDFTNLGQLLQAISILAEEGAMSATFGSTEPDTLLGKNGSVYFQHGDSQALWEKVGGSWMKRIIIPDGDTHIGFMHMYAATSVKKGFLFANGTQSLSRINYAKLFAIAGTTWGVGNGSTTFGIMDLRGHFIRGWDANRGIDSGRVFGSVQGYAIENIIGEVGYLANGGLIQSSSKNYSGAFTIGTSKTASVSGVTTAGYNLKIDTSRAVSTATETRPVNTALYACIGAY